MIHENTRYVISFKYKDHGDTHYVEHSTTSYKDTCIFLSKLDVWEETDGISIEDIKLYNVNPIQYSSDIIDEMKNSYKEE